MCERRSGDADEQKDVNTEKCRKREALVSF